MKVTFTWLSPLYSYLATFRYFWFAYSLINQPYVIFPRHGNHKDAQTSGIWVAAESPWWAQLEDHSDLTLPSTYRACFWHQQSLNEALLSNQIAPGSRRVTVASIVGAKNWKRRTLVEARELWPPTSTDLASWDKYNIEGFLHLRSVRALEQRTCRVGARWLRAWHCSICVSRKAYLMILRTKVIITCSPPTEIPRRPNRNSTVSVSRRQGQGSLAF